jgi:hypothetical protein
LRLFAFCVMAPVFPYPKEKREPMNSEQAALAYSEGLITYSELARYMAAQYAGRRERAQPARTARKTITQAKARQLKSDLSAARRTIKELKEENRALRALLKKSL